MGFLWQPKPWLNPKPTCILSILFVSLCVYNKTSVCLQEMRYALLVVELCLIVAHPDDECYGAGGTLAEYAAAGHKTGLITLTKGKSGRSLGLCSQDDLPEFRAAELRGSVEALNISHFAHLNYPDAAPAARGENHNDAAPAAFLGGLQDFLIPATTEVVALLEVWQPKIVITFAPDGGNRHPDHIASHQIAMQALQQGGHLARGVRVYAYANPTLLNPDWADTYVPPTHYRDVTAHLVPKLKAIAAHRTQALSTVGFLARLTERIVLETFRRLTPPVQPSEDASQL
jgi:N-acetylglucosamine malate deacetylase 2